ncbi:chromosome segregation ATPase [Ruegeria lacuscaerulensis ITI-1157]|nr:chromosome segregation ATPase [Ruegeria lacuscaerulensis ITI-1157]
MDPITILAIAWLLLPIVLLILWLRALGAKNGAEIRIAEAEATVESLKKKYAPIASVEDEVSTLRVTATEIQKQIEETRSSYSEKRATLKKLEQQVAIYDEKLSFAELGVYEPHFEFNDADGYKQEIKRIRDRQKAMVSAKTSTLCPTDWQVDGSRAKGQTMINRQTRLTMRAFNNECEAAIANTRWNNVNAMEKRILNAAKQIDKANESMNLRISEQYISLKLDELHATHEYRERLKMEKEERAELARAEREEKKLLAEAEAAEREEERYQKLLDKARSEAGVDEGRIAELEAALAAAHATSERARAMAEITKSGYVYIISNIGSFGEDVVKIGLTRRLEPDDRVKELGDASVPFGFDTHAMIYSDEAPALESALHKEFADRRVNASNMRKEFFRVDLEEVEDAVKRLAPSASFFSDREAQEWHETLSRRKEVLKDMARPSDELPEAI